MTIANTMTVANKLVKFGKLVRQKASFNALTLSLRVANKWKRAMIAPSNSVPLPALIVAGLNAFQTIVSQIFVAINSEIPEPKP